MATQGQLGDQQTGSADGMTAPMLIHVVAAPWHFSAAMPTTQRVGFAFGSGVGSGCDGWQQGTSSASSLSHDEQRAPTPPAERLGDRDRAG